MIGKAFVITGVTITIEFEHLDLDEGSSGCDDSLTFYDGMTTAAPVLRRVCGSSLPVTFTSTSNMVFVVFSTNNNTIDSGFLFKYKIGEWTELPNTLG